MAMKDVEMVEEEKLKIDKDQNEGKFNCTYSFNGEDHTLGNLLRYILMKDPDTLFSGYSIPHPSDDLMNVRVQTHTMPTDKVITKALGKISKLSDILSTKFTAANKDYDNKHKE